MKFCQVGAELFHMEGQTDTTKPLVTVRNIANVPKNQPVDAA
jgi:hypothetical protein